MTPPSTRDSGPLPAISIVVPNFNGVATLGRTLESLVSQDYPDLEIIVCDGGSTDDSRAIIHRYSDRITWWCSEPDHGQSHAINKGFARATGEILNWLGSDDELRPGALRAVGEFFRDNADADVLAGATQQTDLGEPRNTFVIRSLNHLDWFPAANCIAQPSCFFRRGLMQRQPLLDETFHYAMDFELYNYFRSVNAGWAFTDTVFSDYAFSSETKSGSGGDKIIAELERIYERYRPQRVPLTALHRRLRLPMERLANRHGRLFHWAAYVPYSVAVIAMLAPFYGFTQVRRMCWRAYA
jgi:glycosyltransferase involved in cell wall biosynthesis